MSICDFTVHKACFPAKNIDKAENSIYFSKKFNNQEIENFNNTFVEQFLLNDSIIVPTEALLIQTDSLNKIVETIKNNKSFCFKTDPGEFGWCATFKVFLS